MTAKENRLKKQVEKEIELENEKWKAQNSDISLTLELESERDNETFWLKTTFPSSQGHFAENLAGGFISGEGGQGEDVEITVFINMQDELIYSICTWGEITNTPNGQTQTKILTFYKTLADALNAL